MEQSNDTDTGDTNSAQPAVPVTSPRIPLVNTAVSFLRNPNVTRSSLMQKEKFLRSKGLTDAEVKMAFQQAGIFAKDPNNTIINMDIMHQTPSLIPLHRTAPETTLHKIYHVVSSTAIVAGVIYSIYYVYKQYIEPLLFGRKKDDREVITDAIDKLDKKVERTIQSLTSEIKQIKDEFRSSSSSDHMLHRDMVSFKNDLDAIKGLLLNRKQFSSPVMPPSIPAWQLQSQRSIGVGESTSNVDADKHDDNGSASGGSSETEVVTKHSDSKHSDSSLELIS